MEDQTEKLLSRSLLAMLDGLPDGATIVESEQFGYFLDLLEGHLLTVLREIHPEWRWDCFDGFVQARASKSREGEVEVFGYCYVMSDQALVPVHVRLQVATVGDEISWLECRLGERGKNGMLRENNSRTATRILFPDAWQPENIDWFYQVTYGVRRG